MHPDAPSAPEALAAALERCPLVAILRGVKSEDIVGIADVLVEEGFTLIEVPLNSPDPLASIAAIVGRYPAPVLVGAGTVLNVAQVAQVAAIGARLVISPNTDVAVIAASVAAGMVSLPGYFTPSEAFAACAAGAHGLKLFPAEAATPAVLKAQRAVLPRDLPILVVGGIGHGMMAPWQDAGAHGFGLGSALYAAGATPNQVREEARRFVGSLNR